MQSSADEARYYIINDERISAMLDQYPNVPSNVSRSYLDDIVYGLIPQDWRGDHQLLDGLLSVALSLLKKKLKKYSDSQSTTKGGWLARLIAKIFG